VDLGTATTLERPQLKALPTCGFPEGMLVLNEGWHFLSKPLVTSQLRALIAGLVSPKCLCAHGQRERAKVKRAARYRGLPGAPLMVAVIAATSTEHKQQDNQQYEHFRVASG
jgi:hypothetical protein